MASNVIWPVEGAELIEGWFAVDEPVPGVFRIQEPLHDENVKSFLVVGSERAMLVDTGMGVADIRRVTDALTDRPVFVVNSHAHWDHIGGNALYDEIWIHEAEAVGLNGVGNETIGWWFTGDFLRGTLPEGVRSDEIAYPATPPTGLLRGGETIDLGGRAFEVIHCPGHSPGGIALWDVEARLLLSTDVAYPCMLLVHDRADLPVYLETFEWLAALEPTPQTVLGSHCDVEMPPAMLAAQRDGLRGIVEGRQHDEDVGNGQVLWRFDGFSVKLG